jgi:hypothetical protein
MKIKLRGTFDNDLALRQDFILGFHGGGNI